MGAQFWPEILVKWEHKVQTFWQQIKVYEQRVLCINLQWARRCWETSQFSQWLDTLLVNTSWDLLALRIINAPPHYSWSECPGALLPYSAHCTMLVCWTYIYLPLICELLICQDHALIPRAEETLASCSHNPPRSSSSAVKVQGSEKMNMEEVILDLSSNSLDLLLMRGLVLLKSQQHLLNVDQVALNHYCA